MKIVLLGKDEPRTYVIETDRVGRIAIVMILRDLGWALYRQRDDEMVQVTKGEDIRYDDTLLVVERAK